VAVEAEAGVVAFGGGGPRVCALHPLPKSKEVIMNPRTFENVAAWFASVTLMFTGLPPKDPSDDDEENEDDEEADEDQEKEPAVIREPDE
jgi:hypothetical protein